MDEHFKTRAGARVQQLNAGSLLSQQTETAIKQYIYNRIALGSLYD